MPNPAVSFRLSVRALEILDSAEEHLGIKRSAAVEQALRHWALTGPLALSMKPVGKPKKNPKKSP